MSEYDVAIIGYGPAGQSAAAILGKLGHRVVVVEQHDGMYGLPRAGHVDHEIMRIFQSIGAADGVAEAAWTMTSYDVFDADGEVLQRLDWNHDGISGWHSDYLHYQPYLEDALDASVRRNANVEVRFGIEACAFEQSADGIELTVRPRGGGSSETIATQFLIGADGANSFVRETLGITMTDFGFEADWLVMDVRPHDPALRIVDSLWNQEMPGAGQICDVERPISLFRCLGPHHCRWEFMLLDGETREAMEDEAACWRLLDRWGVEPANAELIRHAVYTFRSLLADQFSIGRIALIGDAAHLMPPFMGQGMCSGIRDATTLSWRLDLMLRRIAPPSLLDSFGPERSPQVASVIRGSMQLGEVVCTLDPEIAAARDAALRSGEAPPPPPIPGLGDGVLHREGGALGRHAGELSIQGYVISEGRVDRFDDLFAPGWNLIGHDAAIAELPDSHRETLERIGGRVVGLGGEVEDQEGSYAAWLSSLGACAALVRPDFYLFGIASKPSDIPALIEDVEAQLQVARTTA